MAERSGIMLLREQLTVNATGHVLRLPRWAMPLDSEGYWHIPRSAEFHFDDYGIVRFWCGQSRHMQLNRLTNKTPPTMRCGTCEGRADGYERRDGAIFQPRTPFTTPKICPAIGGDSEQCWLCGAKRKYSRDYCGYYETYHRAGELLASVQPCPRHGWRHAYTKYGVLMCSSWQCDFVAGPPAGTP